MKPFHGIVVYEIIDNGKILNGIYTNYIGDELKDDVSDIYNEIAIKNPNEASSIIGNYGLSINNGDEVLKGTLEIALIGVVYILRQSLYNEKDVAIPKFEGFGFKSGNNHLSFTYWEVTKFSTK